MLPAISPAVISHLAMPNSGVRRCGGPAIAGKGRRNLIAWRELRNRWFADSALEGTGFEPSVLRDTTNLSSRLWLVPANRKVGAKENRHTKRRALPPRNRWFESLYCTLRRRVLLCRSIPGL